MEDLVLINVLYLSVYLISCNDEADRSGSGIHRSLYSFFYQEKDEE